jgi:hypothetical protein
MAHEATLCPTHQLCLSGIITTNLSHRRLVLEKQSFSILCAKIGPYLHRVQLPTE